MSTSLVAVQRYYKGNKVIGYDIQDFLSGEVRQFESRELKRLISYEELSIANLKLTSDDRLILITDDETINKQIDFDGKSDNNKRQACVAYDDIVARVLSLYDKAYKTIKVNNFNKDTNTFVLNFATKSSIKHNKEGVLLLFKYTIRHEEHTEWNAPNYFIINTVPIALKVNNETYNIAKITENINCTLQLEEKHILYSERSALEYVKKHFNNIIFNTIEQILNQDEAFKQSVLTSLNEYKTQKRMKKMGSLANKMVENKYKDDSFEASDLVVFLPSALIYAAVFILNSFAEPLGVNLLLTATGGTFINVVIHCLLGSLIDTGTKFGVPFEFNDYLD